MPSKRKIRPFKPLQERAKAQTPLQHAYINSQQRNIQDVLASGPSLSHERKRERGSSPEGLIPPTPEGQAWHDDQPPEWARMDLDLDGIGPGPFEDNPVLMALNQASLNVARLEGVTRWEHQYPHMLEAFLQCRQKTDDWGNSALWDHDFHKSCECPPNNRMEREVVLVDLLCLFSSLT